MKQTCQVPGDAIRCAAIMTRFSCCNSVAFLAKRETGRSRTKPFLTQMLCYSKKFCVTSTTANFTCQDLIRWMRYRGKCSASSCSTMLVALCDLKHFSLFSSFKVDPEQKINPNDSAIVLQNCDVTWLKKCLSSMFEAQMQTSAQGVDQGHWRR
jgi:hypothetical protein